MEDIATAAIDLEHHIQRRIMTQLRQADLPYQLLKPDGVEGNAFNYHLRALKRADLITSQDGLYTLTEKGYLVADGFSSSTMRLMMRPYAYTALLITSGDKVLVYKGKRQPLQDVYCLPTGKMRYGDTLETSIAREAQRRNIAPYVATSLCLLNVRFQRQGRTVIHRPGHLWHLAYEGQLKPHATSNGLSEWHEIEEVLSWAKAAPDVQEGLRRLLSGSNEPIDTTWEIPG